MVKHTLFLVHGMGRHTGGSWHEPIWKKLVETSGRYAFFEDEKLEDWAEPVAIDYDGFIEKALKRWSDQAENFSTFAAKNELRFADDLDWLKKVSAADAGFHISHVIDVLIYRFFKLEQGQIQDAAKLAITKRIQMCRDQDSASQFTLVAHSLGTAVAHDALAELGGAATLDGKPNAFSAKNFSFRSIHMLANVSRVVQTEPKVYKSVVRPGSGGNAYCDRMFSPRHELDPFMLPMPFEPVDWSGYVGEKVRHFHYWDIHDFAHYLDHPRVHVPILRSLTRSTAITKAEAAEAENSYPRFAGVFQGIANAQASIERLGQLAQRMDPDKGLKENWETLLEMWAVLKELKEGLP